MQRLKKTQEFQPTFSMRRFAYTLAKAGKDDTQASLAKKSGISAETVTRWKHVNGFQEWLEGMVAHFRAPILEAIEESGMSHLDEFQYWKEMAIKFGYIDREQKQPQSHTEPPKVLSKEEIIETIRSAREAKK